MPRSRTRTKSPKARPRLTSPKPPRPSSKTCSSSNLKKGSRNQIPVQKSKDKPIVVVPDYNQKESIERNSHNISYLTKTDISDNETYPKFDNILIQSPQDFQIAKLDQSNKNLLNTITQSSITKAYIFRFKRLFRYAISTLKTSKKLRNYSKIFEYLKKNLYAEKPYENEAILRFQIKWMVFPQDDSCEKMHEDDQFCRCFRLKKLAFQGYQIFMRQIQQKKTVYLKAYKFRVSKYFQIYKRYVHSSLRDKSKLYIADRHYGRQLIRRFFENWPIGAYNANMSDTIYHKKRISFQIFKKNCKEKAFLRSLQIQKHRRYLSSRLIFKTLKKIILHKRYWHQACYYKEKFLMKKVFLGGLKILSQKKIRLGKKEALQQYKQNKKLKTKQNCYYELWYHSQCVIADNRNLNLAKEYYQNSIKKKVQEGFKEYSIIKNCELHNEERLVCVSFHGLKNITRKLKLRNVELMRDWLYWKTKKSKRLVFGVLKIGILAKNSKESRAKRFMLKSLKKKVMDNLKRAYLINWRRDIDTLREFQSKIETKQKQQLFVQLYLNVSSQRTRKSALEIKIHDFRKKCELILKIKALCSFKRYLTMSLSNTKKPKHR